VYAPVRTAVVTGQHPYDVPGFSDCVSTLAGVAAYPQHMEDFCADAGGARATYDAIVFYHFHQATPTGEGAWYEAPMKAALERIGESPQGIVVLHHAILAFPRWPFWADLVGIEDRSFSYHVAQTLEVQVADAEHLITRGLQPWTQVDETYLMADPGEGSEVLLTTEHPKSMGCLAWAREFGQARVFCLQLGHDRLAYENPSFREVLRRGVLWAARRT
jgi:type 1 glutamine amidotransferase